MCGRFTQQMSWAELHALYSIFTVPQETSFTPRFNGAPTQDFATCRLDESGNREISVLRWGLVPFWAKDLSIGSRLINARAETVHSKPSFRAAFRQRRCLVPADGWFEWSSVAGQKQPYFIASKDTNPLSIAALWELWDNEGEPLETFTLITTQATSELAKIHHRQPAFVASKDWDAWLSPDSTSSSLLDLVQTPFDGPYRFQAVSKRVNNVRNNTAEIFDPYSEEGLFNLSSQD